MAANEWNWHEAVDQRTFGEWWVVFGFFFCRLDSKIEGTTASVLETLLLKHQHWGPESLCVFTVQCFVFFFYFHTDPNPDFRGSGVRFRSGSGSGLDTGRVRKYLILAKIAASGVFIVFSNFTPNTTSSQSLRTGVRVAGLGEGRLQLEFTVFSNCMPTLTTSQRVKVRRMKVGGIFYFTLNSYIWCLLYFLNLY